MHQVWHDLFTLGMPYPEKIIRSVAVYTFLLVAIRIAGKREIGSVSTSDLIVLLLISNTVQNAIIGDETSLIGGLVGASTLILLNKGIDRLESRSARFHRLIDGEPVELMVDGRLLEDVMEREDINLETLRWAARAASVDGVGDVDRAVLETNGSISIIPGATDNDRSVMERLERIEAMLQTLTAAKHSGVGDV